MTEDNKTMAARIIAEILECKEKTDNGKEYYDTSDTYRYLQEFWDTPPEVKHFVCSWFYRHELMSHHDRELAHVLADQLIFWVHGNRMLMDEFEAMPKWYA